MILRSRDDLLPFQDYCADCRHPLRPQRTSRKDYPGTKLHGGNGRCTECRRKERAKEVEEYLAKAELIDNSPRELDAEETLALAYVKRYADENIATMLGLYEPTKGVPLSDIQLMRNGIFETEAVSMLLEPESAIPRNLRMGVKGRRVA